MAGYICNQCGQKFASWFGRCPECGQWNTIEAVVEETKIKTGKVDPAKAVDFKKLKQVKSFNKRIKTKISELDRVLGGGLVSGEVVLLTGEPGIGKSTLLFQVAANLNALYVSAEESSFQVAEKLRRLKLNSERSFFSEEKEIEKILALVEKEKFEVVIIDSLQTVYSKQVGAPAGSVAQLKAVLQLVLNTAKTLGVPFFLVGHLTKSGEYAGPKTLEHMVDCVLFIEGDRQLPYRIISSSKNRFGNTSEIGMFEMDEKGMKEFFDPLVFSDTSFKKEVGRAKVVEIKGPRVLFYEVQALVVPTFLAVPRRVVKGIDQKRVLLLLAVMRKYMGVPLERFDVYVNVVGGVSLTSPISDLGIIVAVYSSLKDKGVPGDFVFVGEVDLLGKVREDRFLSKIEKEARRLGFKKVVSKKEIAYIRSIKNLNFF